MGSIYEPCWTSLVLEGEERLLRLPLRQLVELQAACDSSITDILNRIVEQDYFADDCPEVLIHALIGGGMGPIAARSLIERVIAAKPLDIIWFMAAEVIGKCVRVFEAPTDGAAPRTEHVGYILWPEVIANAAVMQQPIDVIADMSNWEYTALVKKWQDRNAVQEGKVEPPSAEWFHEQQELLKARGINLQ
jgi:hypothetical protein